MKLSILVLTIPRRINSYFPNLINKLLLQIGDRQDIEILGLFDNKKRSVGQKRNELVRMAQGENLTFIDDDDLPADDYISSIMTCLQDNPTADCIVFDCKTTINNDPTQETYSQYSIRYDYVQWRDGNGKLQWRGKPAHTMIWRSSIAKKYSYVNTNYGEDVDWVKRACLEIKNEVRIDKILYLYTFDSRISETRG